MVTTRSVAERALLFMSKKISSGNARFLVIVFALLIIGVLFYYLAAGSVFQGGKQQENGTAGNSVSGDSLMINADFDVMEANISVIKYINSTPATYEEMRLFPELERYMYEGNNNSKAWIQGWRPVAAFQGNISQYVTLVKAICNGKNIYECNQGTLIEYHNRYYQVFMREYGYLRHAPDR
jgi:hypothetical protein